MGLADRGVSVSEPVALAVGLGVWVCVGTMGVSEGVDVGDAKAGAGVKLAGGRSTVAVGKVATGTAA